VENVVANGVSKQVNYHIKTSPFTYKLGVKDHAFDFTRDFAPSSFEFMFSPPKTKGCSSKFA